MEFKQAQLPNGLTVLGELNDAAASMAGGFFVRTGSRDETAEVAGVSHFLEHMIFKGTQRRTSLDVNREFDQMGAQYNAFTSEENTVFYGAVLPEFQDRLLDLLGDILRPSLRPEDFDMEKNVILDEIARYEDQPHYRVYEKLMAEHFQGHPLGNSVLGTKESISALSLDAMKSYFDSRYCPSNITVVGVGKFDWPAFVDKVAQACGQWPPRHAARQAAAPRPAGGQKLVVDRKVARAHIGMMSPAPSAQDPKRYAAQLAATVVGDDTGSRLYYALVESGMADDATMAYDPLDAAGAMVTFISTDPAQAAEAMRIARHEMKLFVEQGPSEAELTAAKNKIASAATLKGELPMGRLTAVGFDWVYRRQYEPLAQQIEELFAVSRQQVAELVIQYNICAATTLVLGPAQLT